MNMTLLQDVAEVFNGKTPSKAEQRDSGFPVLKIKDVDETGIFRGSFQSFVDEELAQSFEKKIIQEGDILLLNAAHNSEYVGSKNAFVTGAMAGALATGEWTMVRADVKKVMPKYLYFCINSPDIKHGIRNIVKGIHLYPKDLKRLHFPIPPLEDQKRIVSLLDQADALRRKRKESMKLLDEYVQSVFLEMFGDPVTNPKGWEEVMLEEITITSGQNGFFAKKEEYSQNGTPIIWLTDFINLPYARVSGLRRVSASKKDIEKYAVSYGDALFCRSSLNVEGIGRCSIVPKNIPENTIYECHIIRVGLNLDLIIPEFFRELTKTKYFRGQVMRNAKTATMTTISQKGIFDTKIILPNKQLQLDFLKMLDDREIIKSKMSQQKTELDNQFNSIMQRAFAGATSSSNASGMIGSC